jgi:hypothetical protein
LTKQPNIPFHIFSTFIKNLNAPQSDIYPHNVPDFDQHVINHVNEGIHSEQNKYFWLKINQEYL